MLWLKLIGYFLSSKRMSRTTKPISKTQTDNSKINFSEPGKILEYKSFNCICINTVLMVKYRIKNIIPNLFRRFIVLSLN